MELAEVYRIESLRRQAEVEGKADLANQYNRELYERTNHIPHFQFPNSFAMHDVFQTDISRGLIEAIGRTNSDDFTTEIDQAEDFYRSYVERLLDVDLSKVEIVRVAGDYENAEGKAVQCGATDHIVILPPKGEDFVSPDLLIHELGHTGEYTLRRASNDVEMLRTHRLLSETIAHYCQYKYLLEFGTKESRLNALGSVTKDYLLLCAVAAAYHLPDHPAVLQIDRILDHENLDDYRSTYTRSRIAELLSPYDGQSLEALYFLTAEPRMGAVLALHLVEDGSAIRKLCTQKADRPVRKVLEDIGLDADRVMNFGAADKLLREFANGTI